MSVVATDLRRAAPTVATARAGWWLGERATTAAVAVTALAAALRFTRIGHQGFWVDEGYTAALVHLSPAKMVGLIPRTESSPPLYYCLAWGWARLFGYGEAPLRSLSALAGVATVPVLYLTTRRLISTRAALIAAALAACNPLLIWYSQEARSYALAVLLCALALAAFAAAHRRPSTAIVTAWALVCVAALATHYYAALVVVPQALALLVSHRRRRAAWLAVGVVTAFALALVPLAISQAASAHLAWITQIPLSARLGQVVPQLLVGFQAPAYRAIEWTAGVAAVVGLAAASRASRAERRGALLAAALAVGGALLSLSLLAVGTDDLITRNLLVLWLPAAVVISAGLGGRRAGPTGVVAALVLCATGIFVAVSVQLDPRFQRPDWRPLARVLGARPANAGGSRAILIQEYGDPLPLALYLPGLEFWQFGAHQRFTGIGAALKARAVAVSELDVVSFGGRHSPLCWWGAACELWPSPLQASYPIPGFHVLWRKRVRQFSVMRLAAGRPVQLNAAIVSRALRATAPEYDEILIQRSPTRS